MLDSDLPEDEYLGHDLERYFPPPLPERYAERMRAHRLRREIIATVVANQLVDRAGTTFVFRLSEETGASPALLARAYAAAREILEMPSFWSAVEALDNQVDAQIQLKMLIEGRRLVERATRWLVTAYPDQIDIARTIGYFEQGAGMLRAALPDILDGTDREAYECWANELQAAGVPAGSAARVAGMPSMIAVFDIVEAARTSDREPDEVMTVYFRLGSRIELNWLRDRIIDLPRTDLWEALARAAMRDDLYSLHRLLTQEVLEIGGPDSDCEEAIAGVGAAQSTSARAMPRDPRQHQGLPQLQHDDAARGAAGGPKPDQGRRPGGSPSLDRAREHDRRSAPRPGHTQRACCSQLTLRSRKREAACDTCPRASRQPDHVRETRIVREIQRAIWRRRRHRR